jgi:hypothetical protein
MPVINSRVRGYSSSLALEPPRGKPSAAERWEEGQTLSSRLDEVGYRHRLELRVHCCSVNYRLYHIQLVRFEVLPGCTKKMQRCSSLLFKKRTMPGSSSSSTSRIDYDKLRCDRLMFIFSITYAHHPRAVPIDKLERLIVI